ncbi:hypothetical protein GF324_11115 [bacterium]|nr:hypothetical protein [bacterium]
MAALFLLFCFNAGANADIIAELTATNHYMWRGYSNQRNKLILQPAVTWLAGETGFASTVWFNVATLGRERYEVGSDTYEPDKQYDEMDLFLTYTRSLSDQIDIIAGFFHLSYFNREGYWDTYTTTHELFLSGSWTKSRIRLSPTIYYDINPNGGAGAYYHARADYSIPVEKSEGEPVTIHLSADIGYMDQQWRADPGFSDANFMLGLSILDGRFTAKPGIFWTYTFEDPYVNEQWNYRVLLTLSRVFSQP